MYIADAGNYRLRKVDTSGIITTVAGNDQIDLGGTGDGGTATSAALQPSGLAFAAAGNRYVADYSAGRIRKIAFGTAPPGLSVSSTLLYFAGKSGPPQQILTVSSAGAPISFTVAATTTSGGGWLGAGTSSGTTPASIGVNVNNNPSPFSAGTYQRNPYDHADLARLLAGHHGRNPGSQRDGSGSTRNHGRAEWGKQPAGLRGCVGFLSDH